jgi:hypothetical protein
MKFAALTLLLFLTGCCTPVQVQSTLDTAGLLKDAFVAEQTNTNAFIASSNPPAEQMAAFTAAQAVARVQFLGIYRTHVSHLMSLAELDAAVVASALEQITLLIEEAKR